MPEVPVQHGMSVEEGATTTPTFEAGVKHTVNLTWELDTTSQGRQNRALFLLMQAQDRRRGPYLPAQGRQNKALFLLLQGQTRDTGPYSPRFALDDD